MGLVFSSALCLTACSLLVPIEGNLTGGRGADGLDIEAGATDAEGGDAPSPGAVDAASDGGAYDARVGCPPVAPDPDLIVWLPLDDGEGTVARDCSGHGHDGVLQTIPDGGAWTTGRSGSALRFDTGAGCLELGKDSELNLAATSFTLSLWSLHGVLGDLGYLAAKTTAATSKGWRLGAGPADGLGTFRMVQELDGGGAREVTAAGTPTQVWHHLAVVYVPSERIEIWLDGALAEATPITAPFREDTSAALHFGCRSPNNFEYEGLIDEVRLYRRALDAAAISALATEPPTSGHGDAP